ncbi:MAG: class I SAM-dependent methyltransferase [Acidimicrobiales bacterium]|nr:class I SAM-dependent methyltransferase [Acidimicrobiales bacterium]
MGWYEDKALPWVIDRVGASGEMRKHRAQTTEGLHGVVVEIGFGSGLNIPHYPPEVERVLAVDPATYGRVLAADRLAASDVPVDFVGLDGAALPIDDESVDTALSTLTLCTIPEVEDALAEVRRVLRPGGTFHFFEHGRSDDPKVERWQNRLTPAWRRAFGGCHLNRPIDVLLTDAGFDVEIEVFAMQGPRTVGTSYRGRAVKR